MDDYIGNMIKITPDLNIQYSDLMKYVDWDVDFTLRDLISLINKAFIPTDVMYQILGCKNLGEFLKEANREFEPSKEIEYLQVSLKGFIDLDFDNKTRITSSRWEFMGIGKAGVLPSDFKHLPKYVQKRLLSYGKEFRQEFAIEFTPLYKLMGYRIKINPSIDIFDRIELKKIMKSKLSPSKGYAALKNRAEKTIEFTPYITLIELLKTVFDEISVMNTPENRDSTIKLLHERVNNIKELSKKEINKRLENIKNKYKKGKK